MALDDADLHTDTFTNAKGWSAVRVTHGPTGTTAERERTDKLKSAVQAQRECISEIEDRMASAPGSAEVNPEVPVTRTEFEALVERVTRLEQREG